MARIRSICRRCTRSCAAISRSMCRRSPARARCGAPPAQAAPGDSAAYRAEVGGRAEPCSWPMASSSGDLPVAEVPRPAILVEARAAADCPGSGSCAPASRPPARRRRDAERPRSPPISRRLRAAQASRRPRRPAGVRARAPARRSTPSGSAVPSTSRMARMYSAAAAAALPAGLDKRHRSPPGHRDHHRVAIGVEPVSLGDRVLVRRQDRVVARERAHQHEQRGAGEVEVGDQAVHHAEPVSRRDQELGLAAARANHAVAVGRALQCPHDRRADGPDPPAGSADRRSGAARRGGISKRSACIGWSRGIVGLDRLEGARARPQGRARRSRTPLAAEASSSASVKCSPAVGAATLPSRSA